MKQLLKTAFIYLIAGLIGGVLFREVTKISGFTGQTALRLLHVHLISLGTLLFLILVLFSTRVDITTDKGYKRFFVLYNISFVGMICFFLVRGFADIFAQNLSQAASASISGLAGLFHIGMAISLFLLFKILKRGVAKITQN